MRGSIKLGRRWLPFRAHETLTPQRGFIWTARVAGLIAGSDSLIDGEGKLDWKLLDLVHVAHSEGPDISRSAAGRAAAEAVWVPTALLPCFGVEWSTIDDTHATARFAVGDVVVELHFSFDEQGRVVSVVFDRWGDPQMKGTFDNHRFGLEVTEHAAFGGVIIPSAGRVGWSLGTDRRAEGEFFRYRITEHTLLEPET